MGKFGIFIGIKLGNPVTWQCFLCKKGKIWHFYGYLIGQSCSLAVFAM